ncbi:hypothetical protein PAMA_011329 [Pampus argenteus]
MQHGWSKTAGDRVTMSDTVESEMDLSHMDHHFQYYGKEGAYYLAWVSQCVSRDKHKRQTLKNPAGATLRIGGLEDTIYRDKDDEVNAWDNFYLPKTVRMQVLGVVEGTSCASNRLVLMTCEDKKLYAYDGEKMHLVASSWQRLEEIKEIEYPASKSYYKGEAFQDMKKSDAAEVPDSS